MLSRDAITMTLWDVDRQSRRDISRERSRKDIACRCSFVLFRVSSLFLISRIDHFERNWQSTSNTTAARCRKMFNVEYFYHCDILKLFIAIKKKTRFESLVKQFALKTDGLDYNIQQKALTINVSSMNHQSSKSQTRQPFSLSLIF